MKKILLTALVAAVPLCGCSDEKSTYEKIYTSIENCEMFRAPSTELGDFIVQCQKDDTLVQASKMEANSAFMTGPQAGDAAINPESILVNIVPSGDGVCFRVMADGIAFDALPESGFWSVEICK